MLRFSQYLAEAVKFETEDLNGGHLDHVEDLLIKHGKEGLDLSLDFLDNVHKYLKGEPSAANISVKHDGAPAMVFGRLPVKNSDKAGFVPGQFFVATKSAFNKQTQKFITSPEDVQTYFGDRPDLAAKMLAALEHLPKVTPMRGIYQGDFMHTPDMIKQEGDEENGYVLSVNPQLMDYSVPADSKIGQKMAQSQFGIVVHTAYPNAVWKPHPTTGELMLSFPRRQFNVPLRSFGTHPDVHVIDPRATAPIAENYGTDAQAAYERAIKNVQHLTEKHDFDHVAPHADHFSTYINSTVKTGEPMTFEGFLDHVRGKFQRQIENPKNAKKAAAIGQRADEIINDLNMNSVKWRQTMRIHQELTNAKHALMTGLDANAQTNPNLMQGTISDPDTGEVVNSQEGHVVVMRNPQTGNDVPVKFINRPDFSRLNFNRGRFQQQQQAAALELLQQAAAQQQSKEGEAAQPAQ